MPASTPFKLNRSGILLALISAAFANHASGAAGRAEFTIGAVTVARGGVERPLARGAELDNGDVVRTNNGRAQIRFTDGAYVSLQPNTEFGIRDYRYDNRADGNERGFFGLLKGAMRTVTGAIGRINRDRYQIATPTATVGIRGTGGVIQVQDDASTLVIGTSGIWSLTNPAGSVDVPAGTSAVAPSDPNQPPQETTQQPTSGPAPVPEEESVFIAGEEVDEQGLPIVPLPSFTPLVSGSGYATVLAYGANFDGIIGTIDSGTNTTAVFSAAGQLTEATLDTRAGVPYRLEAGGSHAEFGSDGILAWGRWIGPVTIPNLFSVEDFGSNAGLHYVIGLPTATLPTTGQATYTLLGATSPTYIDGATAPGTFSGTLNVTFGASPTVGVDFTIAMPDRTYTLQTPQGPIPIVGSAFSSFQSQTFVSIGGCSSICSARVDGFFAGASAERAGVGYHIDDSFFPNLREVVGTAAFKAP